MQRPASTGRASTPSICGVGPTKVKDAPAHADPPGVGSPRSELPVSLLARHRRHSLSSACVLLALLAALVTLQPDPASAATMRADMESGFGGFSGTSVTSGTLTVSTERAASGTRSALATYDGSGSNGYARGQTNVSWRSGDEVWYSMAVYLPTGFKAAQRGAVDLIRWDNWSTAPSNADHGGLAVSSRGQLVLIKEQLGSQPYTVLLGPYTMPEGRWVHLEVRQRFSSSNGSAVNEVWMDGDRLGSNTTANSYGRTITRLRAGLVSIDSGSQTQPLRLWFDDVVIDSRRVGQQGSGARVAATPTRFTDVYADAVHLEGITALLSAGLTNGCNSSGTRFCPNASVTRGQMASLLAAALELPPASNGPFSDASGAHRASINALAAAGLTTGCDSSGTRYCPDQRLSRAQMATFLTAALDLPASGGGPFRDVTGPHADGVNALAAAGLTSGCNGSGSRYCPNDALTRGQMASILAGPGGVLSRLG